MDDLAALHDIVLDHDLDIIRDAERISEYRVEMYHKKDKKILKKAIPMLDRIIHNAQVYKGWLEEEVGG